MSQALSAPETRNAVPFSRNICVRRFEVDEAQRGLPWNSRGQYSGGSDREG